MDAVTLRNEIENIINEALKGYESIEAWGLWGTCNGWEYLSPETAETVRINITVE